MRTIKGTNQKQFKNPKKFPETGESLPKGTGWGGENGVVDQLRLVAGRKKERTKGGNGKHNQITKRREVPLWQPDAFDSGSWGNNPQATEQGTRCKSRGRNKGRR